MFVNQQHYPIRLDVHWRLIFVAAAVQLYSETTLGETPFKWGRHTLSHRSKKQQDHHGGDAQCSILHLEQHVAEEYDYGPANKV